MNKYLICFMALFVLPVSVFAETLSDKLSSEYQPSALNVDTGKKKTPVFDDRVPLSEKLLREYKTETPNVIYRDRKTEERVGKYYMGLRGGISFYSGKYKQSNGGIDPDSHENFKFKPVLGLDLSVGYRLNDKWRFDGEIGYTGKYSETETEYHFYAEKTDFNFETYYFAANAYYDIAYGLYAGLGTGLTLVNMSVDNTFAGKVSVTNASPMGAAMFGWTYMLDEKIDLDIRYRFSLYNGGKLSIGGAEIDAGTLINNSLSAGIRYHF